MFNVPGVISQRKANHLNYVDTVLADSPLVFLMVEDSALTVLDNRTYPSTYPYIAATPNFGGQILNGFSQSLRNTVTSSSQNTATCFAISDNISFADTYMNSSGSAEMWFLLESTQTSSRILSLHDSMYFWVSSSGINHRANLASRALSPSTVTSALSLSTPYHAVFTWGSQVAKAYINGQVVLDATYSGSVSNSLNASKLLLGTGRGGPGTQAVKGLMQAPALYGYALTGSQVMDHYNAGKL